MAQHTKETYCSFSLRAVVTRTLHYYVIRKLAYILCNVDCLRSVSFIVDSDICTSAIGMDHIFAFLWQQWFRVRATKNYILRA